MEYVWGLHPFIPEHDDEIEFKGGERILVLEKDDVYQDGWWRGTNHMGKTGLFPKDYTTNVPPASVNVSTPSKLASAGALTSLQEDDEPESSPEDRDGKATMMNNLPSLASMDAKLVTPPSITPAPVSVDAPASAPDANGHQRTASGTVLHATMTDIQEAIEQLGVRQNADNASRSFSFASTREGLTTDEEDHRESEDRDFSDEHEFGWNKDARKLLAANASKQQAEAQSALDARLAALSQPPIEVEMSDESEDEDHHRSSDSHNTRRQSYEAAFAIQAATAEAVEAQRRLAEEIPSTPITARPGPYSLASTSGINGSASTNSSYSRHIRHDSDATTVGGGHGFSSQPRSTKVSESTVVGNPRHISSREQLASAVPSLPEAARTPAPPAVVDEAPVIAAATTSVFAAAQSTPLPMSSPATPAPPPTIDASVFPVPPLPTPTPYSVAATPKVLFPVAEEPPAIITPIPVAVVAPAPAPPVEPQIQIPASMASWSTPASPIMSSKPPSEWNVDEVVAWLRSKKFDEGICSKFIEHEISGDVLLELDMNMLKEVDITAFGKRMKLANAIAELRRPPSVASFNPPMSIAPSISANSQMYTQSPVILASGMPPLPYSPESAPHTGDLPGGPFGTIGFADARNGKARPASLALGPEDQVIAGKSMLTSTSGGSVVGDEVRHT
ncbi:hypothetical protein DL93DRAFT_2076077 [Clavulina sp. PMI_390]|nr:hypothetical protein DL93DRAFT_2076077 [Clavulina sp. PMI_390]